jgi:hypothetical protein
MFDSTFNGPDFLLMGVIAFGLWFAHFAYAKHREQGRCIDCGGELNQHGECFDCTYGRGQAFEWPAADRYALELAEFEASVRAGDEKRLVVIQGHGLLV